MQFVSRSVHYPSRVEDDTAMDRQGGLPVGLPSDRWPACRSCDVPLGFLAQLSHHPRRLDLGVAGSVLYAFSCRSASCQGAVGHPHARTGAQTVIVEEHPSGVVAPLLTDAPPPIAPAQALGHWQEAEEAVPSVLSNGLLYGLDQREHRWPDEPRAHRALAELQSNEAARGTKTGGFVVWEGPPAFFQATPEIERWVARAQWAFEHPELPPRIVLIQDRAVGLFDLVFASRADVISRH